MTAFPRVAEEFSYTFTFESTYISWVERVLSFLREQGVRRMGLLTDSSGYGWVLARELVLNRAAEYGIDKVVDVELTTIGEVPTAVTKLTATPTDYLLLLLFGPMQEDILRKLQERRVVTPITGYLDGMSSPINVEGRRFIAQFDTQPWFIERFKTRFPNEKPIRAAFGYDLVRVLGDIVEQTRRRPAADEMLRHFSSLRDYHGATGTISTNGSRNIETQCVLKEIRNGEAVVVAQH